MFVVIASFLIGITSGLRALTGLAVLSWAARLGYVPLEHTWLAFLGYAFTPYILSSLPTSSSPRMVQQRFWISAWQNLSRRKIQQKTNRQKRLRAPLDQRTCEWQRPTIPT
jgi:hypothetical protein